MRALVWRGVLREQSTIKDIAKEFVNLELTTGISAAIQAALLVLKLNRLVSISVPKDSLKTILSAFSNIKNAHLHNILISQKPDAAPVNLLALSVKVPLTSV